MQEFVAAFQLSKMVIYEVRYYTLMNNHTPHFSTCAEEFVPNKRGFNTCGQAQEELLPSFPLAYAFYKKWDKYHLHDLTPEQYAEMRKDLDELKEQYNYLFDELDEAKKPYHGDISFMRLVEFSKQPPKKQG